MPFGRRKNSKETVRSADDEILENPVENEDASALTDAEAVIDDEVEEDEVEPGEDPLFHTENITYRYDNRHTALDRVSVSFYPGELVAVLGGNGAGKSTFLLCMNGVLRPQTGRLYMNGREFSDSNSDVRRQRNMVGLVFQDPDTQIIAGTVESEVSFGPMNLHLPSAEVTARVDEALSQMDIEKLKAHAPHYLSGGEKKRVTIADILAMRPEIICLDEPTASLDPKNAKALEEILLELKANGTTVVISTHDVDFAYRIADRIIVFHRGEVIADATPNEVFAENGLIRRAGLKRPAVYEAWEAVTRKLDFAADVERPRTIEEFTRLVSRR